MKKKLAMYTLVVVTPRHSIKESDRVVRVVAKAPIGNMDCEEVNSDFCPDGEMLTYASSQRFLLYDRERFI